MSTAQQEIILAKEATIPSEEKTIARVEPKLKEASNAVALANDMVIDSHDMAEFASDFLGRVKTAYDDAEIDRKSITGPINDSLKILNAKYKPVTTSFLQAETIVKDKLKAFNDEQERLAEEKRKAAQKKIDDARKKADDEAKKKKEEAAAAATKAAETGDEQAQAEAEVAQEQAEVANDKVEELEYAAPIAVTTRKVSGVSTRKNWKAEITDVNELFKAIVDGTAPAVLKDDEGIQVAMTKVLSKLAKSLEKSMKVPGVRAWNDGSIAAKKK